MLGCLRGRDRGALVAAPPNVECDKPTAQCVHSIPFARSNNHTSAHLMRHANTGCGMQRRIFRWPSPRAGAGAGSRDTRRAPALPTPGTEEAHRRTWATRRTLLELTHSHGTDVDETGEPRGFGHVAVIVDDVYETCRRLEAAGTTFRKRPNNGCTEQLCRSGATPACSAFPARRRHA